MSVTLFLLIDVEFSERLEMWFYIVGFVAEIMKTVIFGIRFYILDCQFLGLLSYLIRIRLFMWKK